jgi:hypothetical protein
MLDTLDTAKRKTFILALVAILLSAIATYQTPEEQFPEDQLGILSLPDRMAIANINDQMPSVFS